MSSAGELLYCSRGKSTCEVAAVQCVCGECPVWRENELSSYYFCMRGDGE